MSCNRKLSFAIHSLRDSYRTNHNLDFIRDGKKDTPLSTIAHTSEAGGDERGAAKAAKRGCLRFGNGGGSSLAVDSAQEGVRFEQNRYHLDIVFENK